MESNLNEGVTPEKEEEEVPNGVSITAIAKTVPAVALVVGMFLMLVGDPIAKERGWTLIQYGVALQVLYLMFKFMEKQ